MQEPFAPSGMSVTIKADEPGGKYNDPKSPGAWIVFHGSPSSIREQIIETFELEASARDMALYALVNEAEKLFKAVLGVGQVLGGTVLKGGSQGSEKGDVWAKAAGEESDKTPPWDTGEKKPEKDPILTALEACQSVAEVTQVWAENQAAFNANADYMAAYKARGKALS